MVDKGEAAVAEAAVGGTAASQNMEQFGGRHRADFADFFEPGQEDERSRRAQYARNKKNRKYLITVKSGDMRHQIAPEQRAEPGRQTVTAIKIAEIFGPFAGGGGIVKIINRTQVKAGPGQAGERLHNAQIGQIFRKKPEQRH